MVQALVAATAGIFALFGGGGHTGDRQDTKPFRPGFEKHATSTAAMTVNIACVAAAVAAREASLDTAVGTYTTDINSAYSARATALASAYAQTDKDGIRKAVKTAWQTFAAALKLDGKNWKKAQRDTWTQFKMAIKSCGGGATSLVDNGNGGGEFEGAN